MRFVLRLLVAIFVLVILCFASAFDQHIDEIDQATWAAPGVLWVHTTEERIE